jgi:aspartyl/asparaginyl-tRNA synthetase
VYNLSGFVDNIRIKGNIAFIIISDSMGKLQITITPEIFDKFKDIVNKLTIGSVIQINGKVIKNDNVKLNQTEMIPNKIKIDSLAELLPIDNNSLIDLKMDYR